jgi:trigger factor
MNITQNAIDALNGKITIEVEKQDYAENVDNALKDYQRKAVVAGFRKGKTPYGIIKKMYGKPVLLEELNKIVSNRLAQYIKENDINIMCDPMLDKVQDGVDITQENFTINYSIAYRPEINVKLTKREKIPFYVVKVDNDMIDNEIHSIQQGNGELRDVEDIQGKELLRGSFVELDASGQEMETSIRKDDGIISLAYLKDKVTAAAFASATIGSRVVFNPARVFPNKTDLAAMLGIEKAVADTLDADFAFTITSIQRYFPATLGQPLYDKLYGEGNVTSEKAFREQVKITIAAQLRGHGEYRFSIDAREKMCKKNEDVLLPEEFIKRWLVATSDNLTLEACEADFPHYIEEFKWQLIRSAFTREYSIQVTEEEIRAIARENAAIQLRQYGLYGLSTEELDTFATQILANHEEREKIRTRAQDNKIFACIKENVKIEETEITIEEFSKLFKTNK